LLVCKIRPFSSLAKALVKALGKGSSYEYRLNVQADFFSLATDAVNAQGTLILILSTFALSGSSTIGNNSTVTALGTGSDLAASQ